VVYVILYHPVFHRESDVGSGVGHSGSLILNSTLLWWFLH